MEMQTEMLPSDTHDQPVVFSNDELQFFVDVDNVVQKAVLAGRPGAHYGVR